MSRMNTGDVIAVKPTNNIYTVLSIIGTVVVIAGVVLMWYHFQSLFGFSLIDSGAGS